MVRPFTPYAYDIFDLVIKKKKIDILFQTLSKQNR